MRARRAGRYHSSLAGSAPGRASAQRVEERDAARRQAVAGVEALGESEGLQPPNVLFEAISRLVDPLAEVPGAHAGMGGDQREHLLRPRPLGRARVDPLQLEVERFARGWIRGGRAQRPPRIGAQGAELDPVDRSLAATRQLREQRLPGVVASALRIGGRDRRRRHRGHRADLELADRGQERASAADGRPAPAAERERHRARADPVEEALPEQHGRALQRRVTVSCRAARTPRAPRSPRDGRTRAPRRCRGRAGATRWCSRRGGRRTPRCGAAPRRGRAPVGAARRRTRRSPR